MENVPEKRKEEEQMTNMEPVEDVMKEPIDEMKIEPIEEMEVEPIAETVSSLEETREPEVVPVVVPVVGEVSIPESEMGMKPDLKRTSTRKKRCHKGSRRNKGSHRCRKINKKKTKRCHKGLRRNKRTHHCRKRTR